MFGNKKVKWFKRKLEGTQKMIWDAEFKREKTLMIREEVRHEYDAVCTRIQLTTDKIKSQLKDPTKICEIHNQEPGKEKVLLAKGTCTCEYNDNHMPIPEVERLYDEKERLEIDRKRHEAQMKHLDVTIKGSPQTNEYPEGMDGINQEIDALRELQGMYREYIRKI